MTTFKPRRLAAVLAAVLAAWPALARPDADAPGGLSPSASAQTLGLAEALRLAEGSSPALQASHARESQAQADVQGAAAFYYPHLVAAAGTGTGLAGSPGLAPLGVAGVIGSPYRAGPKVGGDVSGYWDLVDFSQWFTHAASKDARLGAAQQSRFTRVQVDQSALIQYYDASRALGLAALWHGEAERVASVYKQVRFYESVGRYSEVQLLLLQEMMEQARLAAAGADEQARFTLSQLALTLGRPAAGLQVPAPAGITEADLDVIAAGDGNPLLAFAQAQVDAARHLQDAASAQRLPRVYGNASWGTVDKTLLVPDADYSASIGVALPIFEGFQNAAALDRAQAATREREALLQDAQRQVAYADDRYDDAVALARLRLQSLGSRQAAALRNLTLSKDRYFHLLSPLSDLQQALANLTEIELELNASQADLCSALGAQRLFNGGTPRD
jgi:outer membrane protein TolC